jgi:ADP-dependent phosphofructokinase/glucokinase
MRIDDALLCDMMRHMRSWDWPTAYAELVARLGEYGAHARWTFCGLGACVDAVMSAHDAVAALLASSNVSARALGQTLEQRAGAGVGGEVRVHWDDGPDWLDAALPLRKALGGTAAHAARVLTRLGAPALLALSHRDAEQMGCLDGDICLAIDGRATPARNVDPHGAPRPKIYIFEFTAGRRVGDTLAPRSSRVIVRFTDPDIENDQQFEALSTAMGAEAGAAVLSGFNGIRAADLDRALAQARALALRWRAAGVPIVHMEMGGFEILELRDRTVDGLRDGFNSIGFSQSEYRAMAPGDAPDTATIVATAERLGVDRLCIHADTWALAATRGDRDQERTALMMGCLLAGTRAAVGQPVRPAAVNPSAQYDEPPEESRRGAWNIVACSAPYLPHPATTLGLGDTFMAGCLLVLGQQHRPDAEQFSRRNMRLATTDSTHSGSMN